MTHEANDGLFTLGQQSGSVSQEEAGYMISDLVSALSEAKPKDGTKASVTLRQDALREGRTMLKRLLQHGWEPQDQAELRQASQDAPRTPRTEKATNEPQDDADAADEATEDEDTPWTTASEVIPG